MLGVKWYNNKIQSPSNPTNWQQYITDIRRYWILWKYNPNYSYNLENPEINDPSMGQANVIRKIFKDKVVSINHQLIFFCLHELN